MRITSFVQFRGSIPIFWRHHLDLRYKPRMEIQQRSETFNVLLKHFKTLESHYGGKITAVNLVHSTGWEGRLANVYNDLSQRLEKNNFSYVAFDFHHNCRSMRWDRIDWLISNLSTDIQDQSYFLSVSVPGAADYKIVKTQKGVIRTNCIDCLDRTNVVQSFIAKKVLEIQLCEMFGGTEGCIKNNPLLVYRLNNMWADHGDSVSSHYAGTGAMKTDFTRNGVRTIFGILDDGKKGLLRYIYTHFHDGIAQDALDLFLGKYTVSNSLKSGERNNSPFLMGSSLLFHKKPNWRLLAAPMILVMSLAILIFSMIERSLGSLKLSMLISAILLASIMIMNERSMYVVLPRLVPVPRIKPSKSYLGIPIVRYLKRKFAPKRHLI